MESEMTIQEPSYENIEHNKPKEMRDIKIKRASELKRSNSAYLPGVLITETNDKALNIINNYVMHLR